MRPPRIAQSSASCQSGHITAMYISVAGGSSSKHHRLILSLSRPHHSFLYLHLWANPVPFATHREVWKQMRDAKSASKQSMSACDFDRCRTLLIHHHLRNRRPVLRSGELGFSSHDSKARSQARDGRSTALCSCICGRRIFLTFETHKGALKQSLETPSEDKKRPQALTTGAIP